MAIDKNMLSILDMSDPVFLGGHVKSLYMITQSLIDNLKENIDETDMDNPDNVRKVIRLLKEIGDLYHEASNDFQHLVDKHVLDLANKN